MTRLPLVHCSIRLDCIVLDDSCNCVLIGKISSKEAVLVDPGGNEELILKMIEKHQANVTAILITHGHFDHFLAAAAIKEVTKAPICISAADTMLYNALAIQCGMFGISPVPVAKPIDQYLKDGDSILDGNGVCIATPGHSPGSMCFYFSNLNLICTGDTLFKGSVGRTDLMGGNAAQLKQSILEKLYTLPKNLNVIPGHGDKTTIGDECQNNSVIRMNSSRI